MGELKKWRDQDWVRIDSSGNIAGKCGTSKDKTSTAKKKKREGAKGKQVVSNTKAAKVSFKSGGEVRKLNKGCGAVLSNRRKRTRYA